MGRIFEICVEKGFELPVGDPNRKYKGRVVFQGNNVKDQNWQAALFNEMSSAPASMEASKACYAFGLLPGHATQQCDAEQAYIHSKLEGAPRMPRERWPAAWAKFRDPVCPLVLALYGHPDAGGCWEKHCESRLRSVGFAPIADWRSCFWHEKLSLFLTAYVDDFKMSGPAGNLAAGWELIRKHVRTEAPQPIGKYLGCDHRAVPGPLASVNQDILSLLTLPLPGSEPTPALSQGGPKAAAASSASAKGVREPGGAAVNAIMWDMSDFLKQCVALYQELGGPKAQTLRKVDTPFTDVPLSERAPAEGASGELTPIASKLLRKILLRPVWPDTTF